MDLIFSKSLIGSLRSLACTRLDVLFATGAINRFMEAPTYTHLEVALRILHHLKDSIDLELFYSSFSDFNLVGFCDSDYAGDIAN